MNTNTQTEKNRAEDQAKAQFQSICEMVAALKKADTEHAPQSERDNTQTAIQEDPLSVEVRSGWYNPGAKSDPEEFQILLCTGGPAVRIIGTLAQYNEPEHARIEYQDWFTPWQEYRLTSDEEDTLLDYCRQFYFGDFIHFTP